MSLCLNLIPSFLCVCFSQIKMIMMMMIMMMGKSAEYIIGQDILYVGYSRFMGGFEACIVERDNSTKHRIKDKYSSFNRFFFFLQRDLINFYTGIIYEFVFNEILLNILCYHDCYTFDNCHTLSLQLCSLHQTIII